ncbi:MAG: hypothetical protein K2N94_03145 [Lachnospiraceae bacterium]|nr:hypothetical protein [Lachnospiraceae bacterium]
MNDPDRITVLLERILGTRLGPADFTTDFSDISDPAAGASDSLDPATGVSDPSNPAAVISDPSDPAANASDSLDSAAGISGSSGGGWLPAASETAPAPSGAPDILPPLLGFTQYHIKIEEVSPWLFFWHYYAETANGDEQCIAEVFGPGDEPEAYIVDLDSDGITELICNCEYGDSAKRVYIFRSKDGIIEEGVFNEDYYRTEFTNIDTMCGAARIVQKYDPEKRAFFVANIEAEELINQTFFMGLDYFNFRPFIHIK